MQARNWYKSRQNVSAQMGATSSTSNLITEIYSLTKGCYASYMPSQLVQLGDIGYFDDEFHFIKQGNVADTDTFPATDVYKQAFVMRRPARPEGPTNGNFVSTKAQNVGFNLGANMPNGPSILFKADFTDSNQAYLVTDTMQPDSIDNLAALATFISSFSDESWRKQYLVVTAVYKSKSFLMGGSTKSEDNVTISATLPVGPGSPIGPVTLATAGLHFSKSSNAIYGVEAGFIGGEYHPLFRVMRLDTDLHLDKKPAVLKPVGPNKL